MFTQLDDDGQKFVMVYASWSNNETEAKYNSYEGGVPRCCLGGFSFLVLSVW